MPNQVGDSATIESLSTAVKGDSILFDRLESSVVEEDGVVYVDTRIARIDTKRLNREQIVQRLDRLKARVARLEADLVEIDAILNP